MIENGFYLIKPEFIELIKSIGGLYQDNQDRPVFCCFKDRFVKGLFWAIPTSDYNHRNPEQMKKYDYFNSLSDNDLRSAYYYIGHTNKRAIYRISNCFPIIDKYVEKPFISNGQQLFLEDKGDVSIIRKKLSRILFYEQNKPNKYEQHITDIKNHLIEELKNT